MASNASRGAYYKARTRKYFESKGFYVFDMEVVRWVGRPGQARFPIKRDQLGADLGVMNAAGITFLQIKGGQQAVGSGTFPDARRKFAEFTWPDSPAISRAIVAWAPRAREPRILIVGRTQE